MEQYKVSLVWCLGGKQFERVFDWTRQKHDYCISSALEKSIPYLGKASHLQTAMINCDILAQEVVDEAGCDIRFTMTINGLAGITFSLLASDGDCDSFRAARNTYYFSVMPETADGNDLKRSIMEILTNPEHTVPLFTHCKSYM